EKRPLPGVFARIFHRNVLWLLGGIRPQTQLQRGRNVRRTLFAAVLAAALVVLAVSATGASSGTAKTHDGPQAVVDDIPGPLAEKQRALRERAIQLQASGASGVAPAGGS